MLLNGTPSWSFQTFLTLIISMATWVTGIQGPLTTALSKETSTQELHHRPPANDLNPQLWLYEKCALHSPGGKVMASKGCTSPRANKETQAFLCDKHSSSNIRLVLRTHTLLHISPQKQPVARRSKNNHILTASFFSGLSWMRPQEEKWCSAQKSVPSDKHRSYEEMCKTLVQQNGQ